MVKVDSVRHRGINQSFMPGFIIHRDLVDHEIGDILDLEGDVHDP